MKTTIAKNTKTIIATQGGKGGVGKTTIAIEIAAALKASGQSFQMMDFDEENVKGGGLRYYFPEVTHLNSSERRQLDKIVELALRMTEDVLLVDFGARYSVATFEFMDEVFESHKETIRWISVGIVTDDPASLSSVFKWADNLSLKAKYLIVLNRQNDPDVDFSEVKNDQTFVDFQETFRPVVIEFPSLVPDVTRALRKKCVTPAAVAADEAHLDQVTDETRSNSWHRKCQKVLLPAIEQLLLGD